MRRYGFCRSYLEHHALLISHKWCRDEACAGCCRYRLFFRSLLRCPIIDHVCTSPRECPHSCQLNNDTNSLEPEHLAGLTICSWPRSNTIEHSPFLMASSGNSESRDSSSLESATGAKRHLLNSQKMRGAYKTYHNMSSS